MLSVVAAALMQETKAWRQPTDAIWSSFCAAMCQQVGVDGLTTQIYPGCGYDCDEQEPAH